MICTSCNKEIVDRARFCGYCGHKLEETAPIKASQEEAKPLNEEKKRYIHKPEVEIQKVETMEVKITEVEKPKAETLELEKTESKKSPKKRRFRLIYLYTFVIFLGIMSGMLSAYYIQKNGWESLIGAEGVDKLPFAEKLPFIKTSRPEMEIYYDLDPISEEDVDTKDDTKEKSE